MTTESEETQEQPPLLRIVKGDPKPEEVAALVAVVSALASAAGDAPAPRRSAWSAHHRKLRTTHRPGPDAWRTSAI